MIDLNRLGMELVVAGDYEQAIATLRQGITKEANSGNCHVNLAVAWLLRNAPGDAQAACDALQTALTINADQPLADLYLGLAYANLEDDDRALVYLNRAMLSEPSSFGLRHLSMLNFRLGRWSESLQLCDRLLDRWPDDQSAHFNRALNLLALGRFKEGWVEYEFRNRSSYDLPEWRGEPIDDRHLLLYAEQGMGDSLQFWRFIPDIAARCRRLSVYERPEARALLAANFPQIDVITIPPGTADCYAGLLSLGGILHLDSSNINYPPYIRQSTNLDWQQRLGSLPQPKVGLVWAGDPNHLLSRSRAIERACVERLCTAHPLGWVSLQVPPDPILPAGMRMDAAPYLHDWSDTAAAIATLDLIITVDTAIAHLAGAMGKPVWLLNRFDSCWRWGQRLEHTAWYRSMRIFRQSKPKDWGPVIDAVGIALGESSK